MRILYFHRGYFPAVGGAEMMTYHLAATLQRRGHSIRVVCLDGADITGYQHTNDIEVLPISKVNIGGVLLAPELTDVNWQPDVVHAVDAVWPEFPRAAMSLARLRGTPFVITPASAIDTWQEPSSTLAVCHQADIVFVLTNTERQLYIQRGITADRLVVTGQGPDLAGVPNPEGFRLSHGVSGPLVLFLGRKLRSKGYCELLAASRLVWTERPDTYFAFVGPRWDPDCLEIFARFADPRIIEVGIITEAEKHSALSACDLVCLPSTVDVFPLVIVEAWACGKPVVVSPFEGAREIVRDGEDGSIVAPIPSVLASAILRLLKDANVRHSMGSQGLARVYSQFNWEVVADRVEDAYNRLLT